MCDFVMTDDPPEALGWSLKRIARVGAAVSTGGLSTLATKKGRKEAAKVVKSPKRIVRITAAAATGGLSTLATKKGRKEAAGVARGAAHVVATGGRAVGHVAAQAGRVAYRVARRIIMALARKLLFKGGGMHGDGGAMSKNSAKALLIPMATAAVGSQAPVAAAAVPVLVNSVLDELYSRMAKKKASGKSDAQVAAELDAELSKEDSGEAYGGKGGLPSWALWGGGALLLGGVALAVTSKKVAHG